MKRFVAIVVAALLLGAVAQMGACEEKKAAAPVPKTPAPIGRGIVRGVVRFIGTPPTMPQILNHPCHDGAGVIHEETVVVGPENGMANVIVYLKDGPTGDGSARPAALLDQKDCHYIPHVLAIQVGQPLLVHSSDPTLHNVHIIADANPSQNFGQTTVGAQKTLTFTAPELPIRVKCDVHPWMTAYLAVLPTPCFSVTGLTGHFEITGVPPGKYTLTAWHEKYGPLTQQITVTEDQPLQQTIEYKAP